MTNATYKRVRVCVKNALDEFSFHGPRHIVKACYLNGNNEPRYLEIKMVNSTTIHVLREIDLAEWWFDIHGNVIKEEFPKLKYRRSPQPRKE